MPFGNAAAPSVVYAYGCRIASGQDVIDEQLLLAHRYRNTLIALERERREKVASLLRSLAPSLEVLETAIADADAASAAAAQSAKSFRAEKRQRTKLPDELSERIKATKLQLKLLRAEAKLKKAELYKSVEFRKQQSAIDNEHNAALRAARKVSGVYWGTYLAVERSLSNIRSGAPPEFRQLPAADKHAFNLLELQGRTPDASTTLDGRICAQIQGGLSPAQLLIAEDPRLTMKPFREQKHVWTVRVRLAKDVYVTVTAKFHRPLPEDCQIKNVTLLRRRVGTQTKWSLQFACARDSGWAPRDRAGQGILAVNIGWRLMDDASIRALTWLGDDGQQGELHLDARHVGLLAQVKSLQSIRDQNFATMKLQLLSWLEDHTVPDWLQLSLAHFAKWSSQAKLDVTVRLWQRFPGDEEIYETLLAWRKQDRHLFNWERHASKRYYRWRLDSYRKFAAKMRTCYHTLRLAHVRWKTIQAKPAIDQPDEMAAARRNKGLVAPFELEQCLRGAFGLIEPIDSKDVSATCANCGKLSGELLPSKLYHTCVSCDETYDQDVNHCRNLLAAHPSEKSQ